MLNLCKVAGLFCDHDMLMDAKFMEHVANHGLSYGTAEEYAFRQRLYLQKDGIINEINADPANTFTVGHNFMSTWTDTEYKRLLGYRAPKNPKTKPTPILDEVNIPASIDWRTRGAVNPVKNQAQCGSCWAFSAVAAMEGRHAISSGNLESFSEQQIVSCDYQCYGCSGGWQSYAMEYVEQNGGIALEAVYPYTSGSGVTGTCHTPSSLASDYQVSSDAQVTADSGAQLKAAIAQGPVSVTVEADRAVFQQYTGGVLNSAACGTSLDHAIAAVGYGTESGQDYYLVRNSWSASWGDAGYIKIAVQTSGPGICGIQQTSVYPLGN